MKTDNLPFDNVSSNIFLTACIFLANIDFTGLIDYAAKAIIGGGIWLGYKVTADMIQRNRQNKL